ncbi:hypothetical protein GCM10022377_10470 [Zhihengliuella alba]|uniref:DNA-binding protein n=1 Tax=Zhihengliuella alba TaxID=547018 RepID=A0ABP7D1G6_9MICC
MAYFRTPEEVAPELGITPTTLRLICKNTGFCTRLERRRITLTQADIERVLRHLAVEQEKKNRWWEEPEPDPFAEEPHGRPAATP